MPSSAGHALGQIIGDWFERDVALPLLQSVSSALDLRLESRFSDARQGKIIWHDVDENAVDYDFVITMPDGLTPVAFFETFWRRGSRHSKDKARDDSNKLRPMRDTYPTARVLSIVAAGEFTAPAREYVKSLGIELFYIPKDKIVEAWSGQNVNMDYSDGQDEEYKSVLLSEITAKIEKDPGLLKKIAKDLMDSLGETRIGSYKERIRGALSSLPVEFRIVLQQSSDPIVFATIEELNRMVCADEPELPPGETTRTYTYEVDYSNGDSFARHGLSWMDLQRLHGSLAELAEHVSQ